MEEEKHQKELFEFDQPKKSFSRLSDMLPRADFEGKVMLTISLEKLIFISIGVIMVMVVLYAMGVESGKSSVKDYGSRSVKTAEASLKPPMLQGEAASIPPKSILSTAPLASLVRPAAQTKAIASVAAKPQVSNAASKPFTIRAGTFTKMENARTAGSILAKQGFVVTITYNAPYYMVNAGAYTDKNLPEAQKDLARIRRIYKDATIKIR